MAQETKVALIEAFLASPCDIGGWEEKTWRQWFADALTQLCVEGEGFSGKRPNCDSGWTWDLAAGLARIDPKIVTKWEDPEEDTRRSPAAVNWPRVSKVVTVVIQHLCGITVAKEVPSGVSREHEQDD